MSFNSYLTTLKKTSEDFEWYSTTKIILDALGQRLKELKSDHYTKFGSFCDVGAGDGKVLDYVNGLEIFGDFFAVELSNFHLSNLKPEYKILGVNFHNVSFLDKEIDVIFINPPYSEYEEWMIKLINETPRKSYLYFVVPQRWKNNQLVNDAIKNRNVKSKVLGSFSFENSENRKARANVDLIEIEGIRNSYDREDNDPFYKFFQANYKYPEPVEIENLEKKVEKNKLVAGQNLVEILCSLFNDRMLELHNNYAAICSLPRDLLDEFEIKKDSLIESMKSKLKNTKKEYWNRLFSGMKNINRLLTYKSRQNVTGLLNDSTGLDFNRENCYAIILWVIKNANTLFDKQLIETYEELLEYANVENYVSNKRVFSKNQFRYNYYREESNEVTHIKLKVGHRIVLERCGGLEKSHWASRKGLSQRAANLIGDLLVVAHNLGFLPVEDAPKEYEWDSSEAVNYHFSRIKIKEGDEGKEKKELLFKVRCYYNGNIHLSLNPEFVHALNISFGRLKKWINEPQEAAQEMGVDLATAEKFYNSSFRIGENQLLLA